MLIAVLEGAGYACYLAIDHPEYGKYVLAKIKSKICRSNLVIGIISGKLSVFVQEELAYAEDRVPVIKMVRAGTRVDASGFTHGREFEPFEADEFKASALRVLRYIQKHGIKNLPMHQVPVDLPEHSPRHAPVARDPAEGWIPDPEIFPARMRRIRPMPGGSQRRNLLRPLLRSPRVAPGSGPGGMGGAAPASAGGVPRRARLPLSRMSGVTRPKSVGARPKSHKTGSRRQELAYTMISKSLYSAKATVEEILIEYKACDNCRGGELTRHKVRILALWKKLFDLSRALDKVIRTSGGHLHYMTRHRIKMISRLCNNVPSPSRRKPSAAPAFYAYLLSEISDAAANLMDVFPKYPEERMFDVSCDRSVYPVGGKIHVLACAPDAEYRAPMRFEIFDSKMDLIDVKITSAMHSRMPHQSIATHRASFRMSKDRCKINEEYTVRATYGDRQEEDRFTIERYEPIIQVDRESHAVGDNMIITVIDPNSDRDSKTVEYVGDRRDSRLVIEADHGRIEGYRLEETGPSTGIFQGIVGILGVSEDGIVAPRRSGELAVGRTPDAGMDRLYIAARPGGRITLTYECGPISVRLECMVAGPSPSTGSVMRA